MYHWKQNRITLKITYQKKEIMRTLEEKNFEMMKRFALTAVEMLSVRGGDGEGGGDDSDPEKPPIKVILP
jgi:hypothetical protein